MMVPENTGDNLYISPIGFAMQTILNQTFNFRSSYLQYAAVNTFFLDNDKTFGFS